MNTKKLTFSALLVALGAFLGNLIFIPIGAAKCFPVQHAINVISAVILGPFYSVSIAFCISFLRNIVGTGSLLAFPGSMIGAAIAGVLYKKTGKEFLAVLGEIIGTGLIGGLLAFPMAKFIMGKEVAGLFFIVPFSISSVGGSIIGYTIIKLIGEKILNKNEVLWRG
ncbi:energy coupling factor transporter S component ThiW [Clostridium cochlearium]|uniref:energy coupling factor transporter S component ThiW n=1 Tax=Clostridium cochlearium TaxID=1494 RepID=UPI000B9471BD|nr:energy coupling factor transporter S component ThiW [Clostridium cochlearium]MBV1818862.1 energy coupling factor transporter S component ThiW [Bacteroidales bacterium MSK.15.36]NSJ91549.1 energy coupling factor transporter S component ThiW [Coprococcus sp. MSK.21.13]MCG4571581.1 energy coupling factor transporter S component ThiW [Clostridium cochlearium]MCG4581072.1 energy coupling factor transporter S component ThiW [Clostridium cochlearium]SNV82077.1 thiamine-precursor transport protein 